jgi:MoxR-like ATPase
LFSASNHLAEDEALGALFDRFLLRCHVDHLKREAMPRLLAAGWALERSTGATTSVSAADLRALSRKIHDVDLTKVTEPYAEVVFKVRDLGVAISDRRAVKMLKLLAASALLSGRNAANPSDLWVLRYVWDRVEQIDPLAALINGVLDRHRDEPAAHPLAAVPEAVDAEELARQLELAEKDLERGPTSLVELARLREHVGGIADKAAWIGEDLARKHLLERVARIFAKVGT